MKYLFCILTISISSMATAVPIMNRNEAGSSTYITIYPDSHNKDLFYVAPNSFVISKNEAGRPNFNYIELSQNWFQKKAIIQMTLTAAYNQDDIENTFNGIKEKNPNAVFTSLPFSKSNLSTTGPLKGLVEENHCDHIAGVVGQEQACSFVLTPKGRSAFLKAIQKKALFTTLQFDYTVDAFVQLPDGGYEIRQFTHGVGALVDGAMLAEFPHLIIKSMDALTE